MTAWRLNIMALVYIDNDPWWDAKTVSERFCFLIPENRFACFRLIEYESCEKLYREIEGILNSRDLELKSSEKYILCSSQVRLRLKQFADEVQQLSSKLQGLAESKAVYPLLLKI